MLQPPGHFDPDVAHTPYAINNALSSLTFFTPKSTDSHENLRRWQPQNPTDPPQLEVAVNAALGPDFKNPLCIRRFDIS